MKQIPLTQGKFALVDNEDYNWLNQWKWGANKGGNTYYAIRNSSGKLTKRKTILMHREILKALKEMECDHINHNGLDNRRLNLRLATKSQNAKNRISYGVSKDLGVYFHIMSGKWEAKIKSNKQSIYLGLYKKETDAAKAYNKAALKYHGEFANLNVI